jgi:hypothetical protein
MRRFAVSLLAALLAIPLLAAPAAAAPGDAQVSVIHGVPGLVVDVYLDGAEVLPDFEFEDVAGPLTVASGSHDVQVFADGTAPPGDAAALEATLEFPPGANLTAVAHLDADGNPTLSVFDNDTSSVFAGFGSVAVHHTAEAPAVDVLVNGGVAFADVANGDSASADLDGGTYEVTLNAAGTDNQAFPASGAIDLPVTGGELINVYAIGTLGSTFTVVTQSLPLNDYTGSALVDVVHGVPGLTVDVWANGLPLITDFEPGDIASQVLLTAGTYDIAIYPAGSDPLTTAPAISAPGVEVPAGANAAVVAHLDEMGAPTASVFINDISSIAAGEARVTVRHTAAAPAVDVLAGGSPLFEDVANGDEGVADVPTGTYAVTLNAAGTDTQAFPATGAVDLPLEEGANTIVYAIGDLTGGSFDLLVSSIAGLGPDGAFSDVASSVHRSDITLMALADVARGTPDGRFVPDQELTRGQMAAFVRRALALPNSSTDFFTDDDTSEFEADINAIAAFGITFGYGNGTYGPDDTITRGQMAAFLNRAFALDAGGDTPFTDIGGSIFEADIEAIFAADITKGATDTLFDPEGDVTRGQMASFLARALGLS